MPVTSPTNKQMSAKFGPKTVVEAKLISIALVKYVDVEGVEQVQLALVGDNTVHLLNSRRWASLTHRARGLLRRG